MTPKTKTRGRPSLAKTEGKREAVALRTTTSAKKQMILAAEKSGKSLSQEIESRMERSMLEDELFGTGDLRSLVQQTAADLRALERTSKKSWQTDVESFLAAELLLINGLKSFASDEVLAAVEAQNKLEYQMIEIEREIHACEQRLATLTNYLIKSPLETQLHALMVKRLELSNKLVEKYTAGETKWEIALEALHEVKNQEEAESDGS